MSTGDLEWFDEALTQPLEAGGLEGALWVLVGVSLLGDVVTTFVGLHVGLSESNPIARSAIESAGLLGMLGLKALAVGVALALRPVMPPEYRPIIPAALAFPWLLAALFNVYAISTAV